jgi:hypothetical protein
MTTRKRRRSKVDPFVDQLGKVPDTEIAKLAGVTPENVRAYRKRRGIPARWRGEGQGHDKPVRAPTRAKKAKGGKHRKTKLEPYLDQLGVLPDTEVAELAGVTVGNVRAYRYRHGIPSARQAAKDEDGQPDRPSAATPAPMSAPPAAPAPAEPEKPEVPLEPTPPATDRAEAQAPAAESKEPSTQARAFRIKVEGVGGTVAYVVIAEDIAAAASKALRTLEQRRVEGEVLSVEFLAMALKG